MCRIRIGNYFITISGSDSLGNHFHLFETIEQHIKMKFATTSLCYLVSATLQSHASDAQSFVSRKTQEHFVVDGESYPIFLIANQL
jgi:hypothetical protein